MTLIACFDHRKAR